METATTSVLVAVLMGGASMPALGDEDAAKSNARVVEEVPDARLERRLEQIYAEIEGLEDISVEVVSGVVRLGGTTPSGTRQERAVELAESTPGVVEVVDDTDVSTDVWSRIRPALDSLEKKFWGLVARLPLFGVAVVVFGAFALASRLVSRRRQLFERLIDNTFVRALFRQLLALVIAILGAVTALELLDATAVVGAILGTAGIVGLAIGFAFKDTVENYIASVLMTLRQPFSPNDHVVIGDQEGHVVRLTSRATILMTPDGNHVRIPNATVFSSTMTNFTRSPFRRFAFDIGVGTTDDLVEATALATDTLSEMEGVMQEPAPETQVLELGDSNVQVRVFGWVDQSSYDFLRVRSEAVRLVKTAFDDAAVSMPEPTYNVRLYDEQRGFSAREGDDSKPRVREVRANLRPDRHIEKQVAAEQVEEQDLLSSRAKLE